jgi:hypothetical protein
MSSCTDTGARSRRALLGEDPNFAPPLTHSVVNVRTRFHVFRSIAMFLRTWIEACSVAVFADDDSEACRSFSGVRCGVHLFAYTVQLGKFF